MRSWDFAQDFLYSRACFHFFRIIIKYLFVCVCVVYFCAKR